MTSADAALPDWRTPDSSDESADKERGQLGDNNEAHADVVGSQAKKKKKKKKNSTVLGTILGVVIGGVLGLASSAYQVFGTGEATEKQFLRTEQKNAYIQYELDQDAVVSNASDFADLLADPNADARSLGAATAERNQLYNKYLLDVDSINLLGSFHTIQIVQSIYKIHEDIHAAVQQGIKASRPNSQLASTLKAKISSLDPLDVEFKSGAREDLGVS